ncbi:hypothetical protein IL306_008184, partial [Fusarium sp. DS 682]
MSYIRVAWGLFLRQLSLLPKALGRIFLSCRQLFSYQLESPAKVSSPQYHSPINTQLDNQKRINNVHTSRNAIGMDYQPQEVVAIIHHSTNAIIGSLGDNVVLKYPRYAWWDFPDAEQKYSAVRDAKASFFIEGKILELLGSHPRIVKYEILNSHQANTDKLAGFWDDLTPKVSNLQKQTKEIFS